MGDVPEVQLHIRGNTSMNPSDGAQEPPGSSKGATVIGQPPPPPPPPYSTLRRWKWWSMVFLNVFFLLAGLIAATLLLRFYYNEGGSSMWMATLVQSAGAPLLILPLLFFRSPRSPPSSSSSSATPVPRPPPPPPLAKTAAIYVALGLLVAGDNLMYSYGLRYLPVSTYSLVCASQLAFNAVFSYLLNRQRFTALILNSVVVLTFSAALVGLNSDSDGSGGAPQGKHVLGFVLTLGASATVSLILSLMQLAFEKVIKREDFAAVLEMQLCVNLVASCACVVGLLAGGEWRSLGVEMEGYRQGGVSYVMTLVWIAILWQVSYVGMIGLVFTVSSLFSNVISTVSLPLVPIFAVAFFHDKMNGVKVVALLIAMWGFLSYIYQHYLDDSRLQETKKVNATQTDEVSAASP